MRSRYFFIMLKVLALVLPFYLVYYGPLHERPGDPEMKALWKYVLLGFLGYVLLGIAIAIF